MKILTLFMSLLTTLSLFFGTAGSPDYEKQTGLQEAANSLFNKNEIINTKYTGEVSSYIWNKTDEYKLEDTIVLKKEKGKDFVILNITDTHFSDYDYRAFTAFDVEMKIKTLVANIKPDLITISGDIVCTDSTYYSARRITDLFEGFGIPWAPFFGNHDAEGNCDLNYIADIMMKAPNCILQKGDPEMGVGNYIVNIAEENEDGTINVVESLIIMDSHHSQANEKQVEWFKWAAEGINKISDYNAELTLMFHIPLPEYQYAYDAAWDCDRKCWKEGYRAFGECNEKICCERDANDEPLQRGFFDSIKEAETAKYIFCGHEHLNNFSIEYEGVRLTYCLKVGIGSGYKFNFSGGTEIRIGNDGINRISHKSVAFGPVITIEDIVI